MIQANLVDQRKLKFFISWRQEDYQISLAEGIKHLEDYLRLLTQQDIADLEELQTLRKLAEKSSKK